MDLLIEGIGMAHTDALVTPTNAAQVGLLRTTYASLITATKDNDELPPHRVTFFEGRAIYIHNLN